MYRTNIFRILSFFIILLLTACGGSKQLANEEHDGSRNARGYSGTASRTGGSGDRVADYISLYAPIAVREMELYHIPASITLAQGILESGAGQGSLSRRANNHFGIKCHGWKGAKVYHDDDREQECFRKYVNARYSFRDHSLFLTERKRYAALFELRPDDYEGWAKGLKAAGYATDNRYPQKLISLIERYQLYRFDRGMSALEGLTSSGDMYIVRKGDTLYSIAKKHDLSVEQLKDFNNLDSNIIGIGQRLNLSK